MAEKKRFNYLNYSRDGYIGSFYLNDKPITNKEVWDLLNEQEEMIQKQNDVLTIIHELCNVILNNDFKNVNGKVDFCRTLFEMDIKDLMFLKECFEAIKDNDGMTKQRFTLEMEYLNGNPQGRKLFDNLTGQEGMSVEELCNIASVLHSKCEELESVLKVYEDDLIKLEDENKELQEEIEQLK